MSSPTLVSDPVAVLSSFHFNHLRHRLFFHPSIADSLVYRDNERVRKRLGLVLQHLATHGRTPNVKGTKGKEIEGWRRSPLGGNGGMQFYLWWAPQGARHVAHLPLSSGDIVVRAVRHHDELSPLQAGELGDYLEIGPKELDDSGIVAAPWTEQQIEFVEADSPVRMLLGSPGSGKTSALYRAVETRADQHVLYVTWSRQLAQQAEQRFDSFANASLNIQVVDFLSLVGAMTGYDLSRISLEESQVRFRRKIGRFGPQPLGPWRDRHDSLHAELRAYLFGRAVPGEQGVDDGRPIARLTPEKYRAVRGVRGGIGKEAAKHVLGLLELSDKAGVDFHEVFPELKAASDATRRLRDHQLPSGYDTFDRIVVDELQDLTLLEFSVIIELVREIALQHGIAPRVLVAGDDAQTVRPSGFEWGPYKRLLGTRVGTPKSFRLEDNVRSPQRIASVLQRASQRYGELDKMLRPTNQRYVAADPGMEGHVFLVRVPSVRQAIDILAELADMDSVAIVTPTDDFPDWIPSSRTKRRVSSSDVSLGDLDMRLLSLADRVLSPAHVKGLEYQVVCVVEPGKLLVSLDQLEGEEAPEQLDRYVMRTMLDQFRVSLSRATEALVFFEVDSDERLAHDAFTATKQMLGDIAETMDAEDLLAYLRSGSHASVEERVERWMAESVAMLDERPDASWHYATQAMGLALRDLNEREELLSGEQRHEALETLLSVASRLLVEELPKGLSLDDVVSVARDALLMVGRREDIRAFEALEPWARGKQGSPFELLSAAVELGERGGWLRGALASSRQRLLASLDELTAERTYAAEYSWDVEAWLQLLGFSGDVEARSRELRIRAVRTLLEASELENIDDVLAGIEPEEPLLTARVFEAQGLYERAAEAFERAGDGVSALRNWRNEGQWDKALSLAEGQEAADIEWLRDLADLVRRRPRGLQQRMTEQERRLVSKLLEAAAGGGKSR